VNTGRSKGYVGRKVLADLRMLGGKTNLKGVAIGFITAGTSHHR